MLDSEYVCLILLLLLNSQQAKTLATIGLETIIMYSNIPGTSPFVYWSNWTNENRASCKRLMKRKAEAASIIYLGYQYTLSTVHPSPARISFSMSSITMM